jgi:hypothetical protein
MMVYHYTQVSGLHPLCTILKHILESGSVSTVKRKYWETPAQMGLLESTVVQRFIWPVTDAGIPCYFIQGQKQIPFPKSCILSEHQMMDKVKKFNNPDFR